MFLIQISDTGFINAELISFVGIEEGVVIFNLANDGGAYVVDPAYAKPFLHEITYGLNQSIINIESTFHGELKENAGS